jgi:hypothetical protein
MTWKAFILRIVASLVAGFIFSVIFHGIGFDQGKRDGYKVGWQDALRAESGKIAEMLEQEIRPQVMQAVIQEKCGEEIRKAQDEGYRRGRAEAAEAASTEAFLRQFLDWLGNRLHEAESLAQEYSGNPDPKLQAKIN